MCGALCYTSIVIPFALDRLYYILFKYPLFRIIYKLRHFIVNLLKLQKEVALFCSIEGDTWKHEPQTSVE